MTYSFDVRLRASVVLIRVAFFSGVAGFFLGGARDASALLNTIVVNDGGSVVAAVAAAQNGDTIEIRSNQTFVGSLGWINKFLTIQAGAGFTPTIQGSPGSDALTHAWGYVGTGAGGAFKGVTLKTGGNRAVTLPIGDETKITFDRVTFVGEVLLTGTGYYYTNARFSDCDFKGQFVMGDTGDAFKDVLLERNRFSDGLVASTLSHSGFNLLGVNNVLVNAVKTPGDVGIYVIGDIYNGTTTKARFVNTTVVGYDVGLWGAFNAKATFENMLLFNKDDVNLSDLDPAFGSVTIRNSLVSDRTGAGTNGNIGGIPTLGPDGRLLPGSLGIDAGNNSALNIPGTDILGLARIRDGNSDGVARVDVGAFEVVPEPGSWALASLGGLALVRRRRGNAVR